MLLTLDLRVQSVSFSHGPKLRPRFEHHANRRSGKVDGTHGGCHSATGAQILLGFWSVVVLHPQKNDGHTKYPLRLALATIFLAS